MKKPNLKNMLKHVFGISVFTLLAFSGFAQGSYTSADVVGNWEDASIWTKEFGWMAAPTNSVGGSYTYNVNGYITRSGDLSVSGSGAIEVYDTLVIAGNLNMTTSTGITVHPGGLLIILGDFFSTGGGNKINVQGNGRVAIIGNYDQQQGSVTTGNAFYIYDTTPNFTSGGCNGGASVDGTSYGCSNGPLAALVDDQSDLEANDPDLGDFLTDLGVTCGFATILSSDQIVCSGSAVAALTGNTVNGSPTYLWQSSTTSATTGFSTASGTTNAKDYAPGGLTQTTWFRRVTTRSSCGNNGPVIRVIVNPGGTWTGTSSAVWTTAGNWCGGLPTSTTDVRIGVVASGNYPTVSSAANARDIQIDLGATVTVSSNTLNIYGNFTNNGTFTVNGTVNLAGTAEQTLTLSSGSFSFNTLIVANSSTAGVVFNNDVLVRSTLTLTQGKVNMTGKILTIGTATGSRGTLTNPVGATSWIYNGTMERWFTTANLANNNYQGYYPLGTSADFRPFWISNPGAAGLRPTTGGTFRVTHTGASTTTDVTSLAIADGGTIQRRQNSSWTVTSANSLAGGTYVLQAGGTGFGTVNMTSHLRLMRFNNVDGANVAASGNTTSFLTMRTGLTFANMAAPFYIGSINGTLSPLPIKLLSFTVNATEKGVVLDWSTASEINFDYFQLERAGENFEFTTVTTIAGKGGQDITVDYDYLDVAPLSGVQYYRLKSVDLDGTFEYSNAIAVTVTSTNGLANGVSLYPNPVVNKSFTISLNDALSTPVELTVVNTLGYALYTTTIVSSETVVELPANIDSGIYLVKLRSAVEQKTIRVVVK